MSTIYYMKMEKYFGRIIEVIFTGHAHTVPICEEDRNVDISFFYADNKIFYLFCLLECTKHARQNASSCIFYVDKEVGNEVSLRSKKF